MKKVLFVATVVKTHINRFHVPYLKRFKEMGFKTVVAAKNDYDETEDCIIPYCDKFYDIPFNRSPISFSNITSYKQLKNVIDKGKYDIIHCHTPVGAMLTRISAINARKNGTKVIYTAHGFHFFKGAPGINWIIYYPVEKFCSRFTDVLITINKEDYSLAKRKMKAKQIEYVKGVGVELSKYDVNVTDRKIYREKLNIPENAILLISVGELNSNKNHRLVIETLAEIKNKSIYYIIAGQGDKEEELKSLVEGCGLSKYVRFLGFRNDISELCSISDIFIFPSHREGLSLSLMEAMASGLPCLVSKIRGNTDLIDENGGFFFSHDNVDECRSAIENVVKSKELRKKMGAYNKEKVKEFSLEEVMKKMERIYRSL